MKKIIDKIWRPFFLILIFTLFGILIYQTNEIEKKRNGMYHIEIGKDDYWTEEITFDSDGSLNFINERNKRPYKIYGGNYIIAEPKTNTKWKN